MEFLFTFFPETIAAARLHLETKRITPYPAMNFSVDDVDKERDKDKRRKSTPNRKNFCVSDNFILNEVHAKFPPKRNLNLNTRTLSLNKHIRFNTNSEQSSNEQNGTGKSTMSANGKNAEQKIGDTKTSNTKTVSGTLKQEPQNRQTQKKHDEDVSFDRTNIGPLSDTESENERAVSDATQHQNQVNPSSNLSVDDRLKQILGFASCDVETSTTMSATKNKNSKSARTSSAGTKGRTIQQQQQQKQQQQQQQPQQKQQQQQPHQHQVQQQQQNQSYLNVLKRKFDERQRKLNPTMAKKAKKDISAQTSGPQHAQRQESPTHNRHTLDFSSSSDEDVPAQVKLT